MAIVQSVHSKFSICLSGFCQKKKTNKKFSSEICIFVALARALFLLLFVNTDMDRTNKWTCIRASYWCDGKKSQQNPKKKKPETQTIESVRIKMRVYFYLHCGNKSINQKYDKKFGGVVAHSFQSILLDLFQWLPIFGDLISTETVSAALTVSRRLSERLFPFYFSTLSLMCYQHFGQNEKANIFY